MTQDLLLFLVAMLAGSINAIAGGGTFFTFPVLLFTGMHPIAANATSTMALVPGSFASAFGYREDIRRQKAIIGSLILPSVLGSVAGAITLLFTPEQTFRGLIPWLLFAGTSVFALSPRLVAFIRLRFHGKDHLKHIGFVLTFIMQTAISFYGGYFGAAAGILMMAMMGMMGLKDIHEMNGIKALLAVLLNGIATITFVIAGVIVWHAAAIMLIGAMIGGYYGVSVAKKLPQPTIRKFVIVVGYTLTLYFFWKY